MKEFKSLESPFLTLEMAAQYLGISPKTLFAYNHQHAIRYYKVRGRRCYYQKEDLDNFILNEDNLVKSNAEVQAEVLSKLGGRNG